MKRKDLLGIYDLDLKEIRLLLEEGKKFKKELAQGRRTFDLLKGQSVISLFYEASTRTRSSFEVAAKRLGADFINIVADESTSVSKGETLVDTAKNLEAMNPDILVLRHKISGAPQLLARKLHIPVINAGDGFHEHPTQALLDALTIEEHFKTIAGLHVAIIGDIAHSRVARSNIHLLKKLGAKIIVCGPPTLIPPEIEAFKIKSTYSVEEAIHNADVVMMLRVQTERQNQQQFPSINEYHKFWALDIEKAKLLKDKAIIMHPGPMNRGVEIATEVADSGKSVILDQVTNGVAVRMAVLKLFSKISRDLVWQKE